MINGILHLAVHKKIVVCIQAVVEHSSGIRDALGIHMLNNPYAQWLFFPSIMDMFTFSLGGRYLCLIFVKTLEYPHEVEILLCRDSLHFSFTTYSPLVRSNDCYQATQMKVAVYYNFPFRENFKSACLIFQRPCFKDSLILFYNIKSIIGLFCGSWLPPWQLLQLSLII